MTITHAVEGLLLLMIEDTSDPFELLHLLIKDTNSYSQVDPSTDIRSCTNGCVHLGQV